MSTTTLILIYLSIALVGSRLPYIRVYLAHCYNLITQVVCVCLEGGRKNKIQLHQDGSTETTGIMISPFKKALISYAGYTGASAASIGLFYLISRGSYHLVIYLFLAITVISLLLWIRNLFGMIWGISLTAILGLPAFLSFYRMNLPVHINYDMVLINISILLASSLFIQSMICAIQVCKQCFMSRSNPARTAALLQTKFVPAVILGLALVGQTVYTGYFFVQKFISLPFSF